MEDYKNHKSFIRQSGEYVIVCARCEQKTKFELTKILNEKLIPISHGICKKCEEEVEKEFLLK